MNPSQSEELDFKLVSCPVCGAGLFYIAGDLATFSIRVKCRRCTTRQRAPVYVILQISAVQTVAPDVDSDGDNFACA
jgi:hypothetical protein